MMDSQSSGKSRGAIEAMVFVLSFERQFNSLEYQSFLGSKEDFSKDFSILHQTLSFDVKIEDDKPTEKSENLSGVLFQDIGDKEQLNWTFRAQDNSLVVSCFYYTNWGDESQKAVKYLLKMASLVGRDNSVVLMALQTVDKFMENGRQYDIYNVLNKKSKYLTEKIISSGELWHLYQGWFDEVELDLDAKFLNVVELSTKKIFDDLSTSINHKIQLIFSSGVGVDSLSVNLEKFFCELYEENKRIVREILSDSEKKRLGL